MLEIIIKIIVSIILAASSIVVIESAPTSEIAPTSGVVTIEPTLAPCYDGENNPLTYDECLALGVDPAWTPDPNGPIFEYPRDCPVYDPNDDTTWWASLQCPDTYTNYFGTPDPNEIIVPDPTPEVTP
jgi:hypothetical protein